MTPNPDRARSIAGISVFLGLVTGVAGLVTATFAFFSYNWAGAGICLVAAGLAFGLIANAVLRR